LAEGHESMERTWWEWILWGIFIISLALVAYNMITHTKPAQQLLIIQLLGLGCGLIVMVRGRNKKK
jgi:hypothetical protein